jgi:hypothetical protein
MTFRSPPGPRVYHASPLRNWLDRHHPDTPLKGPAGLAEQTGISITTLYRLRAGRTNVVQEATADQILVRLDAQLDDVYPTGPSYQHHAATAA